MEANKIKDQCGQQHADANLDVDFSCQKKFRC
jgi:hypothetical protein